MNIKILMHIMPWEIDYALISFIQLKKSKYHLPDGINVTIETVLNLSSYVINWEESKIPKEFFIEKYNSISQLLIDYNHIKKVYEEKEMYGHLNFQREAISPEIEYYISTCPDMYFSEYLIAYMIEGVKQIKNKYFALTPQISKLWDSTWDEITNPQYTGIDYDKWSNVDIFDIRYNSKQNNQEVELSTLYNNKWAGWFDLYNKAFYEELCPIQKEWSGYGPWDWYGMILTDYAKKQGVDFQQYLLKGETIFEYSIGPLKDNGFSKYYKDMLSLNKIPNQREQFESRMQEYLQKGIQQLKDKKII